MSTLTGPSGGDNPYQSPPAAEPAVVTELQPTVTKRTLDIMQQTKPWVRFLSILGFISAAFMLLAAFVLGFGNRFGRMQGVISVVYAVMAVLYVVGSVYLSRYASRITELQYTRDVESLESALEAQKSFWKLLGSVVAIMLLLYAVGIAIAVIVGLSSRSI